MEQPGCLHATMDLYKWAYKLSPATPSELLADCFALAADVRELDMRASPYDLADLGLPARPRSRPRPGAPSTRAPRPGSPSERPRCAGGWSSCATRSLRSLPPPRPFRELNRFPHPGPVRER